VAEAKIIFGFHAVTGRLRQNAAGVSEIYVEAARHDARARELAKLAADRNVRVIQVDGHRLDGLTGNARHQGVAARVAVTALKQDLQAIVADAGKAALLLVLDGVQDPHNLGACLRVADAFGVHAVIAPKDRAVGLTPAVAKVASGAAETVPYITVTNLARSLRELKEDGVWIVGTDDRATSSLYEMQFDGPLAWVLGAEGEGMRRLTREHCDELARIPMAGSVESLNVSVAAGVCISETVRQRLISRRIS
jgi:23S rRNA (guanosine2251-2'-O)-methyltransferase